MPTIAKAGRYEILGELGRGAMGVVYRAIDPVIGRNVAVKTIRLTEEGTGLTRPELLSRFQTEARAAGLLTHPNIVVVYDAGEEDGLYYITMELVVGQSLQAVFDTADSFPVSRVLRILEQTCGALQFAHDRNIVHRDIKPANLMLTADDTVKVTDFGTAKILQFGTVQQTTHVMGTPSYMSPEQVKGKPVDGRTDIFSLGVVLYEMLTGEKPFPGQSITTVIYKIVNEEPIPPRQLNPSIHPGLNEIVMRTLAKDPDQRYQSCREMLEDLRNYRALGGNERNPEATLISPRGQNGGPPFSTPTAPLRTPRIEEQNTIAAARTLQRRATTPLQTPTVRRTGPLPPLVDPPEKKSNTFATILAAVFLISVITYGVMRLRPELQAVRAHNNPPPVHVPPTASTTPPKSAPAATSPAATSPASPAPSETPVEKPAETVTAPPKSDTNSPAVTTPDPAPPAVVIPRKSEPAISPAAAQYQQQVQQALASANLANRVKVTATASTVTVSGKLRPTEHSQLLKAMHDAPAGVHVVDDTQDEDSPAASSPRSPATAAASTNPDNSLIRVATDVPGATATLFDDSGRKLDDCQTPCSFGSLAAMRYSLQVSKTGYAPVQTALELRPGQALDQKLHLEATATGLFITSHPAGADVFINGAKQPGQTPVTLPLGPGQYDLVLRLPGHDAYSGHVVVRDNAQTALDAQLKERSPVHVAWAQVRSTPQGAEIFIDGAPVGEITPARIQIPTGVHIIALRLKGYEIAKTGIQATEGGTVVVEETLHLK